VIITPTEVDLKKIEISDQIVADPSTILSQGLELVSLLEKLRQNQVGLQVLSTKYRQLSKPLKINDNDIILLIDVALFTKNFEVLEISLWVGNTDTMKKYSTTSEREKGLLYWQPTGGDPYLINTKVSIPTEGTEAVARQHGLDNIESFSGPDCRTIREGC